MPMLREDTEICNGNDPIMNLLITALAELPEPGEEVGPESWGPEWDDDIVAIGPPRSHDQRWDDKPDTWSRWLERAGLPDDVADITF